MGRAQKFAELEVSITYTTYFSCALASGANGQDEVAKACPSQRNNPPFRPVPPLKIAKKKTKMNYLQGKSRPGIPRDFEAVLPRVRDTVLLLGGAVFGGELCSALRTGEQYREKMSSR